MRHPDRDQVIAHAYLSGAYTMAEIGGHFGVHYMTVSRAVRKFEEDLKKCCNVRTDPGVFCDAPVNSKLATRISV
jgi:hypothetical protein